MNSFRGAAPFMCGRCAGDPDLRGFVESRAVSRTCDFCSRATRVDSAASADEVVEYVAERLATEYEDAAEQVPYETREGGYQADVRTSIEILWEVGLSTGSEGAFQYIADNLPDLSWVERDYFSLHPFQTLRYGWDGFCEQVKHRTRHLFFEPSDPDEFAQHDEIRPDQMLEALVRLIERAGLVRQLTAGTKLYRVRAHSATTSYSTLAELGPPPRERAVLPNRMSPAGIPMLYCAEDVETAVRETIRRRTTRTHYTVAEMVVDTDLTIVDLVSLPKRRGVFAPDLSREERAGINFLHAFVGDLAKPIRRDGREHVEYVPTQVVTEYLKLRFRSDGQAMLGVRYPSAKVNGGVNVALFADASIDVTYMDGRDVAGLVRLAGCTRIPTLSTGS